MTGFKRSIDAIALGLGIVGFIGCIVAIVGVWIGCARLSRATENFFGKIDHSFLVVRERISQSAERARKSWITTKNIEQSLTDWAKKEAGQRLASLPAVQEKAERLADIIEQADRWLELSESSAAAAQDVLSLATAAGAPTNTQPADRLLEEIKTLRSQMAQARDLVERIGGLTTETRAEKSLEDRIRQSAQLAVRLLATLSSIDTRLEKLEGQVSDIQETVQLGEFKTLRWIRLIAACIALLIAWMAAGQWALSLRGWKGLRESRKDPRP